MRALAWAAVAATGLVAVHLALGGASYAPAKVADPCAPRDWTEPGSLQEVGNQIILSVLDGAACELGVSREEMVLAFESEATLERFGREHGVTESDLEKLARAGLERAIADAERAGALTPRLAKLIRDVADNIPRGLLVDLLDRASGLAIPSR
jgi:hypothetical protein